MPYRDLLTNTMQSMQMVPFELFVAGPVPRKQYIWIYFAHTSWMITVHYN